MKKIGGNRIIIAAGLGIFAIATWFASRPPSPPTLPLAMMATSSAATSPSPPQSSVLPSVQPKQTPLAGTISMTSPTSGAQWIIGEQNTISWSKGTGATGQMYLVNAASGAIAGWIQQNIAPTQTYFPWNTRDVFLGAANPTEKDVLPGKYVIKISSVSPNTPTVVSAPFSIVAAPQQ